MSHSTLRAVCAIVLLSAAFPAASQDVWIYRERTGKRETLIEMSEEASAAGTFIHSRMSDGEAHDTLLDADGRTLSYSFSSPEKDSAYSIIGKDGVLKFGGTLVGAPLARATKIGDQPWYQTVEKSLREYALSGSVRPIRFWIVQPYEAKAYLLQARGEGREEIEVNGSRLEAARVRVGLPGIASVLWSTLYWYRVSDGFFVRYEGVRGIPGTTKTVVELIGKKDASR